MENKTSAPTIDASVLIEFLKFGAVGVAGFVVDAIVVYSLRYAVGLYLAGMISYLVAASVTWACNRAWTFRGRSSGPRYRQWARFLGANLVGFGLNRGTYAALIGTLAVARAQPVLAVASGAIAGMFLNFTLSRRVVFR
jgi:putative flippase GtrA